MKSLTNDFIHEGIIKYYNTVFHTHYSMAEPFIK